MLRSAVLVFVLGGCGDPTPVEVPGRVEDANGDPVAGALVRAAGGAETTTDREGAFVVRVPSGSARAIRAVAPGRCPAEAIVEVAEGVPDVVLRLAPRLALRDTELRETGFDRTVEIAVDTPCDSQEPLRWEQVAGPELADRMQVSDGGRQLRVRLPPLDAAPSSTEVVALAYADVPLYRLEVAGELAGEPHSDTVTLSAATPHPGLAGGTPGTAIYLRGHASIASAPAGAEPSLVAGSPFSRFVPDVEGRYLIAFGERRLPLFVSSREGTPRDCGAAGCHVTERELFESSPHSNELAVSSGERCGSCHELASTPEALGCASCHVPHPSPFEAHDPALFGAGVCATCHDTVDDPEAPPHPSSPHRQWLASTKAHAPSNGTEEAGCAHCHTGSGFVRWIETGRIEASDPSPIACASCHDPHEASRPFSLRAFERAPELVDLPARSLGSGAICVWCHRAQNPRRDLVDAPHSPQANVLLGRGAMLLRRASQPGAHALLADSCVACHMAAPDPESGAGIGGHSFAVRDAETPAGAPAASACAGCHGRDVPVQAIGGIRDWDGDGRADNVGREFAGALARVKRRLAARIRLTGLEDDCGSPAAAADVGVHEGRMVLVDAEGHYLGDCDRDGRVGAGRVVTVERLSDHMRKLIWDLGLIEADGSEGRHNPAFVFELLRTIEDEI